jgi:HD-GYP domain-containing protein (c-di-GMP phosphodiesterase class II)
MQEALTQAVKDLDLFVKLSINPNGEEYPARHSLHVAMLAAAIAANLGWDRQNIVQIGIGALIHDLGMLMVPGKVFTRQSILSDGDFGKIVTHPLRTFDLIEQNLSSVPLASRMVAYQIHERCNGTGYPRKRNAALIHEAAKVAAVADVYVALVSPRPHREPLMPYYAIDYLIRGVPTGAFDVQAIRGLLKTVSLFPIGSYVELSDGRRGRVLRSNPDDYYQPVLEVWQPNELDAPPEVLELATSPNSRIHRPLARLAA